MFLNSLDLCFTCDDVGLKEKKLGTVLSSMCHGLENHKLPFIMWYAYYNFFKVL